MQIEIPAELYVRFAAVADAQQDDEFPYLRSVLFERKNNLLFAVATMKHVAVIELIGANTGADEYAAITIDPALVAQITTEIAFDSKMQIVTIPSLNMATIKTTFGYQYPGNALVDLPENNHLLRWREWFPRTMATNSFGAMNMVTEHIKLLIDASVSGNIVFPEFIDIQQPVLLGDYQTRNWYGLFKADLKTRAKVIPPTLPEWLK